MLRLELEPITSSYFLLPFSKHLFSLVHGTKTEGFKNHTFEKKIDLRPFSKVSIFIEHYIKLNTNLVSLEDRQTYGAIRNESLFFMRARKKNLCANDALF